MARIKQKTNMRTGRRIVCVFVSVLLLGSTTARTQELSADDLLHLAEDVGRWLTGTLETSPSQPIWPDDVLNPDTVGYDLSAGVAGKVVFFSALYRATGKDEFRLQATLGAKFLSDLLSDPASFDGNNRKASLYSGVAGIGVALANVADLPTVVTHNDDTERVVTLLRHWKVEDNAGVYWSDEYNDLIYGDAGTVLFLSWYGRKSGDEQAMSLAASGASSLLARAEVSNNQKYWRFRRSKPFNIPNFSHGTAGIGYVLATVGLATDDDALKQGANAAFSYLKSIAQTEDGRLHIPYGWPNESWAGLFEFGWAHGLAGNISFFRRLQEAGIDASAARTYERLAISTLTDINLPGSPRPPFSEPSTAFDLRFGRAGVLMALSLGHDSNLPDISTLRLDLWRYLESVAIRKEGTAYWQSEVPAFMGGGQAAYTGLFHGAAGIGLSLLALHSQLVGSDPYFELPDYPN